jgi:hypothetical protein
MRLNEGKKKNSRVSFKNAAYFPHTSADRISDVTFRG